MEVVLAEFGTGQVLWSMVWFTLFFLWIWLVIAVFSDIFRSPDLSGWGKALWSLFVIFLPYLGIFVYLIARGKLMSEHAMAQAQAHDAATRAYIRETVATSPPAASDPLAQLKDLRDAGTIDEAEYERLRARVTTT